MAAGQIFYSLKIHVSTQATGVTEVTMRLSNEHGWSLSFPVKGLVKKVIFLLKKFGGNIFHGKTASIRLNPPKMGWHCRQLCESYKPTLASIKSCFSPVYWQKHG